MSDLAARADSMLSSGTGNVRKPSWWRDPWRKPRILASLTWLYIAWSLLPILIAVALSFNAGRSNTTFQT
jgi:hypothetical protein